MDCPKCHGKLRQKSTRIKDNQFTRTKVCNKCGYKTYTIEIERKSFITTNNLVRSLRLLISEYSENLK